MEFRKQKENIFGIVSHTKTKQNRSVSSVWNDTDRSYYKWNVLLGALISHNFEQNSIFVIFRLSIGGKKRDNWNS